MNSQVQLSLPWNKVIISVVFDWTLNDLPQEVMQKFYLSIPDYLRFELFFFEKQKIKYIYLSVHA